jgi:hypothetical protein
VYNFDFPNIYCYNIRVYYASDMMDA